jgi:ABC-type branched-subunit amino acid transport system substrate-binding protein/mono/diheme cytochrome c family protein
MSYWTLAGRESQNVYLPVFHLRLSDVAIHVGGSAPTNSGRAIRSRVRCTGPIRNVAPGREVSGVDSGTPTKRYGLRVGLSNPEQALMRRGSKHTSATILLAACVLLCQSATAASDLSGQEIQGRALFLTGRTDEPAPFATVGAGDVQVPATAVPCASCHGRDGRGRAERGTVAPNITWPMLSASDNRPGRQRPPYSETLVIRAITMGIDAGGNRIDPTMPRFRLSMADAAALLAYIERLGALPEPGLDDHSLVLATVLGADDTAVGLALSAYLSRVNQDGGLFGRQIVLNTEQHTAGDPPGSGVARLAGSAAVFALLAPAIAGDESNAVVAADAEGVPMIGPSTQTKRAAPRSRYVFYLDGGVEAEARALAGFAATLPGTPSVADDGTAVWHTAAAAAVAALSAEGRSPQQFRADAAARFAGNGPVLWFADRAPNNDKLRARGPVQPALLLPGALAAAVRSHGAPAQTWLAFAAGPPDVTADAAAEYRDLAARYGLPRDDRPAQRQALAAAKILLEALRRAGRDVTRERLVDAMESLQDFHTGLIPPVSYSATRRIGTDGIWIVPLGGGSAIWWDR